MRCFLVTVLVAVGMSAASLLAGGVSERAARLHRQAIVVDSHLDVPMQLRGKWSDLSLRGATPHFDIPRAREGGLTAPFFAIYVPASFSAGGAAQEALALFDLVRRVASDHPAELEMAFSVADIRRIKKTGQMAILTGVEGGHAIEDSLAVLRDFYRQGARYMTLTHVNSNHWADSSGPFWLPDFDPREYQIHHGLTDFGREVVREMNRLGMMVDVSHISDQTLEDVLAVSGAPVFASHSSCRALADVPRNLTDDQIRKMARAGGIVMINAASSFLDQAVVEADRAELPKILPEYRRLKLELAANPKQLEEQVEKLLETLPHRKTQWTKVVDHIEHVIQLAGPDAVGLGTDFDGIPTPPEGFEDVSCYPRITEELLRRGFSEQVVRKVMGENFLHFFSRVEKRAH